MIQDHDLAESRTLDDQPKTSVIAAWYRFGVMVDGSPGQDIATEAESTDSANAGQALDETPIAVSTISVRPPAAKIGLLRRGWRLLKRLPARGWRRVNAWWSPKSQRLSAVQLAERLTLKSPGIVEEIHALSLRQIQTEEQRESRLDGKAQGLLVSASLTLTVAFTFGGLLLQHPDYLDSLRAFVLWGGSAASAVVFLYAVALVCGLAASYVAIRALYVRADYQGVDEHVVLAEVALRKADDQAGDGARAAYRRYVAAHYWQIAQHNSDIHNMKADRIKLGQRLFVWFLACLMCIGIALAYSANERLQHPTSVSTRCTP